MIINSANQFEFLRSFTYGSRFVSKTSNLFKTQLSYTRQETCIEGTKNGCGGKPKDKSNELSGSFFKPCCKLI